LWLLKQLAPFSFVTPAQLLSARHMPLKPFEGCGAVEIDKHSGDSRKLAGDKAIRAVSTSHRDFLLLRFAKNKR
jgi:hypothetical protein